MEKLCKKCGKVCIEIPREGKHYGDYRCSDLACNTHNGFVPKPDNFKNKRKSNLKLKKHIPEHLQNMCEICLRKTNLIKQLDLWMEVHHVIEVQSGGDDNPDNLRYVCSQCHQLIHSHRKVMSHYESLINYDK